MGTFSLDLSSSNEEEQEDGKGYTSVSRKTDLLRREFYGISFVSDPKVVYGLDDHETLLEGWWSDFFYFTTRNI